MSSTTERKLAAIMFTDIAGYTAQMSKDEAIAINLLNKKESVLKPLIKKHNGTYVKSTGDGSLSHFNSAVDATMCAKKLQESIYDDKDLNVRVGVHLGDTIFEDGDIRGDGVNIAARLESMSTEGGVFVSKEVYDQLVNQKDFEGISLGLQKMKGVGRLIEVFGLKGNKLSQPDPNQYQDNKIDKHSDDEVPSIAIIPFDNKGADEDIFYTHGITLDIISDVASGGLLRVASLNEVEELGNISFKEKAKALNVRYVSTGSLWKVGDLFRLSIELYDTQESKIIWSDNWQEDWKNLTAIKEKLSKSLLDVLNKNSKNIDSLSSVNTEAYEYYLKGKYKIESLNPKPEDIDIGVGFLKKAIELDGNLIKARKSISVIKMGQGDVKGAIQEMKIVHKILEKSKNKKDKIRLYMTKAMLGFQEHIIMMFEEKRESSIMDITDFQKIEKNITKAIDLSMKLEDLTLIAECRGFYGVVLGIQNEMEKSIEIQKDSLDTFLQINDMKRYCKSAASMCNTLGDGGYYSKAINLGNEVLEINYEHNKAFLIIHLLDSWIIQKENVDKIYNHMKDVIEYLETTKTKMLLGITYQPSAIIYMRRGEYQKAIEILLKLKKTFLSMERQLEQSESLVTEDDYDKEISCARILIALSKRALGDEDSSEIKKLEKILKENKNIEPDKEFYGDYYKYKFFGPEKGKVFLKFAYDKVQEIKSNLKGESLKNFLDAYYVKLILNEWEKINN